MPGVRAYRCPDGSITLDASLRSCPAPPPGVVQLGLTSQATRFLGARGFMITEEEAAALKSRPTETPEPLPLDLRRLLLHALVIGLSAWLLLLLLKRRKRRAR